MRGSSGYGSAATATAESVSASRRGSRRQFWELIEKFQAEGKTIVLTTHYMEEAERLCDRVAIVDHGRVIALGTPSELMESIDVSHLPPPEPRKTTATLEDVFVSLTGRTLRDE